MKHDYIFFLSLSSGWSRLHTDKVHVLFVMAVVVLLVKAKINIGLFQANWAPTNNNSTHARTRLANDGLHANVDVLAAGEVDVSDFGQLGRIEEVSEVFGGNVVGMIQE